MLATAFRALSVGHSKAIVERRFKATTQKPHLKIRSRGMDLERTHFGYFGALFRAETGGYNSVKIMTESQLLLHTKLSTRTPYYLQQLKSFVKSRLYVLTHRSRSFFCAICFVFESHFEGGE